MEKFGRIIKEYGAAILLIGIGSFIFGCVAFAVGTGMTNNEVGGSVFPALLVIVSVAAFLFGGLFLVAGVFAIFTNSNPPQPTQQPSSNPLSQDARRSILQREVNKYVSAGYRVVSQTDTTAQLVRPKQFSCLWFLINALLLIGWIFYLLWYWSKQDEQIYIEIDEFGRVKITR